MTLEKKKENPLVWSM